MLLRGFVSGGMKKTKLKWRDHVTVTLMACRMPKIEMGLRVPGGFLQIPTLCACALFLFLLTLYIYFSIDLVKPLLSRTLVLFCFEAERPIFMWRHQVYCLCLDLVLAIPPLPSNYAFWFSTKDHTDQCPIDVSWDWNEAPDFFIHLFLKGK